MNISSSCHNFDDLRTLLASMNVRFNIIAITETTFKKHTVRNININLNGYAIENTQTEANCGGVHLYIYNFLNYTVRNNKIEKRNVIES